MADRKKYLRNWKLSNKDRINQYQKEYYYRRLGKQPSPDANCAVGRKYELFALSILAGSVDMNEKCFRGKWDIEWNGMRVEVKSSVEKNSGWHFHIKNVGIPDAYLFMLLKNKDEVDKVLLVPGSHVTKRGLYISKKQSIYEKFAFEYKV